MKSKFLFYLLSWTWGLPLSICGGIVALVLLATKHKPKKFGYCYYFEVGKTNWGGLELGMFFLCSKNASEHTKNHEHGHAINNTWFGPFMPLLVSIPSAIRYHYRNIRRQIGKPCITNYDDIWFEKLASDTGAKFMDWYKTK